jgi:hypothetical protein
LGVHSGSISVNAFLEKDYRQKEKEQTLQREALLAVVTDNADSWQPIDISSTRELPKWTLNIKSPNAEPIQIRVNPHEPLQSSALDSIRTLLELPASRPLKLIFDGMTLDSTQTPVQLQLEDDDLLELRF